MSMPTSSRSSQRGSGGSRPGRSPARPRRHAESFFVFEGELTFRFGGQGARGGRDVGVRPPRGRAHVRRDGRRTRALPRLPRPRILVRIRARRTPHRRSRGRGDHRPSGPSRDAPRRHRRAHGLGVLVRGRRAWGKAARPSRARRRLPRRRGRALAQAGRGSARRPGRNLRRSSLRTSCTASTTTAPRTCAASTSTRLRSASATTCAGRTPSSTSTTLRPTEARTRARSSPCVSPGRLST